MELFVPIEFENIEGITDWKESLYTIENVDSKHPIMYINGKKLIGHYEMTDGTSLVVSPQDEIHLCNKKLVFKLQTDKPNYDSILEASKSVNEGNLNVSHILQKDSVEI